METEPINTVDRTAEMTAIRRNSAPRTERGRIVNANAFDNFRFFSRSFLRSACYEETGNDWKERREKIGGKRNGKGGEGWEKSPRIPVNSSEVELTWLARCRGVAAVDVDEDEDEDEEAEDGREEPD